MKNWFNKNYRTLIIAAFLIPIIIVAFVSISHVTVWYDISNPNNWAAYLSVGIEIAALSALAAISANMGRKVYFPFIIVTLVQFIGNIFFAYQFIDINGKLFRDWVELTAPLLSTMGVEETDFIGHKRFLALFSGGLLPMISLSFLHMLVKFSEENKATNTDVQTTNNSIQETQTIDSKDLIAEVSKINLSEDDLRRLEELLMKPQAPNEDLKSAASEYKDEVEKMENIDNNTDDEMISNELYQESEDENIVDVVQEIVDVQVEEIIEPKIELDVENIIVDNQESDDSEIVDGKKNDNIIENNSQIEINDSYNKELIEKKNSESQII
jgi:uncharacterized protein (DUF1778 family)